MKALPLEGGKQISYQFCYDTDLAMFVPCSGWDRSKTVKFLDMRLHRHVIEDFAKNGARLNIQQYRTAEGPPKPMAKPSGSEAWAL
jgi:hypothetical protein